MNRTVSLPPDKVFSQTELLVHIESLENENAQLRERIVGLESSNRSALLHAQRVSEVNSINAKAILASRSWRCTRFLRRRAPEPIFVADLSPEAATVLLITLLQSKSWELTAPVRLAHRAINWLLRVLYRRTEPNGVTPTDAALEPKIPQAESIRIAEISDLSVRPFEDLIGTLRREYEFTVRRGMIEIYDSSQYYAFVSNILDNAILDDKNPVSGDLMSAINGISNRQEAGCIASALAAACLSDHKYTEAKVLADIATGNNLFDLFPQRLSIAADEHAKNEVGDLDSYLKSSFCSVPFGYFGTSTYGDVFACCSGWLRKPIGNLEQQDWETIWQSDSALEIRESILDGSFKYCSPKFCPLIAGRKLLSRSAITDDQLKQYKTQGPSSAVFSHDQSCNLSCPSCRNERIAVGKTQQAKYDDLTKNTLIPIMERCEDVEITGSGDPFGSIHFRKLLADYCAVHKGPRKIKLLTNGVLFDKDAWESLNLEDNVTQVRVSVDATTEHTYRILRRGGDFLRLMKNLEYLGALREQNKFDYFALICIVQKLNFRELPDFIRMAKKFHADGVSFMRITNWGTYSNEEFLDHDVASPNHPEHAVFLKILADPMMTDPIVSLGNLPNNESSSLNPCSL